MRFVKWTPSSNSGHDGNLKRVKSVIDGPDGSKTTYSVYSAVTGGLIFRVDETPIAQPVFI